MAELSGRVALVTGGARGIGAGIARRFAEAGARIAVLDLDAGACADTVAAVEAAGSSALAVPADVADAGAVEAAVAAVVDRFGRLDIVVNNAGILRDRLLADMTEDDWDSVVRVHLRGAFTVTRAAQRPMVEARYGRIITLTSASALGRQEQANYAAAKAGLQGFTRTIALELGPFGITANAIGPGYIDTPMTRALADRLGVPVEQRMEAIAARLPAGRVGRPADIAHAALFFASEAAGYVTGQVLYVDGGWLLL